jgi:hypothetical protein
MSSYAVPVLESPRPVPPNEVLLVASGDLRQSANKVCWPAQAEMEKQLTEALLAEGFTVRRAHPYRDDLEHGFIYNQRMGMDVFIGIHPEAPIIVAEAVWQYSNHVLPGLEHHRGPILTVANWSGQWPGLVGMLNLNGSLHKSGVSFSTLWSKDFKDEFFRRGLRQWLKDHTVQHDTSHVRALELSNLPQAERELGASLAGSLKTRKAILGVFDEGCMGMYNAIIDDRLLTPMGIYKERLSQSALVAAMNSVTDAEAQAVRSWLDKRGFTFVTGVKEETDLTDSQILGQCKMYIAAVRIADEFGCDAIGIQYQQGLKDMAPASDLVEGLTSVRAWMRWSPTGCGRRCNWIRPQRCMTFAGENITAVETSTSLCGCFRFQAPCLPRISRAAMPRRAVNGSRRCTSAWGEAHSTESASPATSYGAVFSSKAARCTPTWAEPPPSNCQRKKQRAGSSRSPRSGRSCTRCCTA